jgi:hypothetical protein
VQIHTHPGTLEKVALNSRARSVAKARVQRSLTDLREDDKEHLGRGINFVAVHTWTSEGRVVLGTDTALGAEQWAALDLIDSLAEMADGGVHTVLWDRALQGWSVDYLMGRHRIQVVGEGVGRKAAELKAARTPRPDEEPARDDLGISESSLTQHTERLAAEYGVPHTKPMAQILRRDVLLAIFLTKEPQPVGTCLYPSESTYDRVFSRAYDLPPAVHDTPDGPCRHDVVIDDSGLYTAEPHPSQEYWVKTSHPKCVSAAPFRRPDGRWGARSPSGSRVPPAPSSTSTRGTRSASGTPGKPPKRTASRLTRGPSPCGPCAGPTRTSTRSSRSETTPSHGTTGSRTPCRTSAGRAL